jgi:hypothetical protein
MGKLSSVAPESMSVSQLLLIRLLQQDAIRWDLGLCSGEHSPLKGLLLNIPCE